MANPLSDVRKTALGAVGLLVLAVLVADPGGLGGEVAAEREAGAGPRPEASPGPVRTVARANWFSAGDSEPETQTVAPPRLGPPPPQVAAHPGAIHPPEPVGPDFPPELRRPG